MFIVEQVEASEVEIGMLVRSRDVDAKIDRYRRVTDKMFPVVTDQMEVHTSAGFSVCTSETHPMAFLRSDGTEDYKMTRDINIDDTVITSVGYSKVTSLHRGDHLYDQNFIDFTIDEDNNYYAGNESGKLILAHNSASLYAVCWHLEIENILVLKNNKGVEENRVRHMDYGIQFNHLFYDRLVNGQSITLFCPNDVPEVYDAFFTDNARFKELYEAAERNPKIRKKTISATELFSLFSQERKDTGRIYLMNVDHANTHSAYDPELAPVRMSNLCAEVTLSTVPMGTMSRTTVALPADDVVSFIHQANLEEKTVNVLQTMADGTVQLELVEDVSRIALCTLSAINWGVIKNPGAFEKVCYMAVRALDNLLDYQNYPVRAARKHTEEYRPLGIGIINFAYFLAKNGARYSDDSGLALVDQWAEAWSYYLIKASMELAKERGACKLNHHTKYSKGIVPIDTRKRAVDDLVPYQTRMDWDGLRADLQKYGIRNSTTMAIMPAECQHWSNELALSDGRRMNFHELLDELAIDWGQIEEMGVPQRYPFPKPVFIKTRHGDRPAYEFYYNGVQDIIEIEFETGVYSFTANHRLQVERDGQAQWVEVGDLREGDDVVSI